MKMFKSLAFASTFAVAAGAADAATLWATSVEYTQGSGITDLTRTNTANALGATDGSFLSLGIGGTAVFSFGQQFTAPVVIVEFNKSKSATNYYEAVEVYGLLLDGTSVFLTTVENIYAQAETGGYTISGDYVFDKLLLVDISEAGKNRDGFDIDSISVTAYVASGGETIAPVPLPAAGFLLAGGMVGLAALRRRNRNS